ncbi:MAG: S8 family serine peptidase [Candidatus Omnitrophota bacterium]
MFFKTRNVFLGFLAVVILLSSISMPSVVHAADVPGTIRYPLTPLEGRKTFDWNTQSTIIVPQQDVQQGPDEIKKCFIEFNEHPAALELGPYPRTSEQYSRAQIYAQNLRNMQDQYVAQLGAIVPALSQRDIEHLVLASNGIIIDLTGLEKEQAEGQGFVKKVHILEDPRFLLRESAPQIGATAVWEDPGFDGSGITVAVIDTGIDYTHADFGSCTIEQYQSGNCAKVAGGNPGALDLTNGHGTHVASIVAGDGIAGDGQPIRGVAPGATLYAYIRGCSLSVEEIVDPNNDDNMEDHLDVVTASFTVGLFGDPDNYCSEAFDNAAEIGVVAVAAASNDYLYETIGNPASGRKVIAVGATFDDSHIWSDQMIDFSSKGPTMDGSVKPDVVAPGAIICAAKAANTVGWTPCIDGTHVSAWGTSMSAPHVAGMAALLLEQHPGWNPDQIKYAIRNSAIDLGYNVLTQGHGRVSAVAASQEPPPVIVKILKDVDTVDEVSFRTQLISYHDELPGEYQYAFDVGYMGSDPYFQPDDLQDPGQWMTNFHQEGAIVLQAGIPQELLQNPIDKSLLPADGIYLARFRTISAGGYDSTDYHTFLVENARVVSPRSGDVIGRETISFSGSIRINPGYRYMIEYEPYLSSLPYFTSDGITLTQEGLEPVEEGALGNFQTPESLPTGFYKFWIRIYDGNQLRWSKPIAVVRVDQELRSGFPARTIRYASESSEADPVLVIKDIDNDGRQEMSFVSYGLTSGYRRSIHIFGSNGEHENTINYGNTYNYFNHHSLILDDFDGDSVDDFLFQSQSHDSFQNPNELRTKRQDGGHIWSRIFAGGLLNGGFIQDTFFVNTDLNNDRAREIIFAQVNSISPFSKSLHLIDFNGDPVSDNWPKTITACRLPELGPSPLVGNFNSNREDKEIAYVGESEAFCDAGVPLMQLYIFNYDGLSVADPVYFSGASYSTPSSGDSNGDGIDEIFVNTDQGVYRYDPATGITAHLLSGIDCSFSTPALGDVDGDGYLDIVVVSANFEAGEATMFSIYVLHQNGTVLSGWPVHGKFTDFHGAILGDVNGDNQVDVLYSDFEDIGDHYFSSIHAKNYLGQEITGFPKYIEPGTTPGKILTDLDGDGTLELVATSKGLQRSSDDDDAGFDENTDLVPRVSLYAWNLNVPDSSFNHLWPSLRQDQQRRGLYAGIGAPLNFQASRQGPNSASLSWNDALASKYVYAYTAEVASDPQFRHLINGASAIDVGIRNYNYRFSDLSAGWYFTRVGSINRDDRSHVMWSSVKTICVPGGHVVCNDQEDDPLTRYKPVDHIFPEGNMEKFWGYFAGGDPDDWTGSGPVEFCPTCH